MADMVKSFFSALRTNKPKDKSLSHFLIMLIACADYSAMPVGNLAGSHHTVDARNTNMHAQHSYG